MSQQDQSLLIRLPLSLREQAAALAHQQGVSLNFFINTALAERVERIAAKTAEREASLPTQE